MLSARNLEVVYDDVVLALRGVSLDVPDGRIVALLGANGAGKTSLLRALTGLLDVHEGEITKGSVSLDGEDLRRTAPEAVVRKGVRRVAVVGRVLPGALFVGLLVVRHLQTFRLGQWSRRLGRRRRLRQGPRAAHWVRVL